jgi:hypothetical protein
MKVSLSSLLLQLSRVCHISQRSTAVTDMFVGGRLARTSQGGTGALGLGIDIILKLFKDRVGMGSEKEYPPKEVPLVLNVDHACPRGLSPLYLSY